MRFSSFLFCLVFCFTLTLASKIIVSPIGNDVSGCGTSQEDACGSIFYAITNSEAGDFVLLYPGTYASAGLATSLSHSVTIAPAVPGEGPPIIDFQGQCLSQSTAAHVITISGYTEDIDVKFELITFANLKCADEFPSIFFIESDQDSGDILARITLDRVTFERNVYTNSEMDGNSAMVMDSMHQNGLITTSAPSGNDVIHLRVHNSLFSQNNAISVSASGPMDMSVFQTGTYNSSLYDMPTFYLEQPRKVNFTACAFNYNYIQDVPIASFIFINAATDGTVVVIDETSFKDGFSPAVRLEGATALSVSDSSFYGLSNNQVRGSIIPPHIGSAAAISSFQTDGASSPSTIHVQDSSFVKNGLNERNKTLPCVIGATGFSSFTIDNSVFEDNGVVPVALSSVSTNGNVHISNSAFTNNNARAVLLPSHGDSNYQATIKSCQFFNNTAPGDLYGAAIEIGGVAASINSASGAHIQKSKITGSSVGIFVGQNEHVTMENMDIDTPISIKCYQADVNAENSDIDSASIDCNQCGVKLNGSNVCSK